MIYAPAFFALQWRFAARASQLRRVPLPQALLECTNFYVRFGCGQAFDPAHPQWQRYLDRLGDAADPVMATHAFHVERAQVPVGPPPAFTSGCFSWEAAGAGRARIHFRNVDGQAPLSPPRLAARREDLTALFAHMQRHAPQDPVVTGASWLYNVPAYRQLFPPGYVASATPVARAWQRLPLWGQFVRHDGGVRPAPSALFLERLDRLATLDGADACFPSQVLAVQAPAAEFYRHFGL